MTFQFRPAKREAVNLMIGLAGPSGSGKSFSALRIATGLAQGGKIAAIDTEARRLSHYAGQFAFECCDFGPPFSPARYLEVIQAAADLKPAVIIVDSISHCHEGPGGILEMHDAELERMAGNDWAKRERVKFAAWIKPKSESNRLVNTLLQMPVHFVFCFRAKEKLALVKDDRGKQQPVSQGWQPICTDRFEYEQTALLMLPPNSKGKPDLTAQATKVQEQHRVIFENKQLTEQTGQALAAWAKGATTAGPAPVPASARTGEPTSAAPGDPPGQSPAAPAVPPTPGSPTGGPGTNSDGNGPATDWRTALQNDMREAATLGTVNMREWYKRVPPDQRPALQLVMEECKGIAAKFDESQKEQSAHSG